MEIQIGDVVNLLKEKHEYKEYKEKFEYPYTFKTLLQKRVKSKCVCECNDRLSININVTELDLNHSKHETYEVSIVAEKKGKWWKLTCYSLNRQEILSNISEVEETLINLFNNI